jgi:hypothetical protein
MGFKMNGSPAKMGTIQGTAGHSSALKMKMEENASALKKKAYGGAGKTWGEYDKASGGALNTDTKTQKEYEAKMRKENPNWDKKSDNTWKTQQNKINKHVGSKVVHSVDEIKNNIENADANGGNKTKTTATEPESKRLTPENKAKETVKIGEQKNVIKDAKTEQRNKRDEAQLEIGLIKSGRDDKYTGTMLSRALARRKVKRNTRQLKNRAAKNASTEQTAENTKTTVETPKDKAIVETPKSEGNYYAFSGKKGDKFKYRNKSDGSDFDYQKKYEFQRPGSDVWETSKTKAGGKAIHDLFVSDYEGQNIEINPIDANNSAAKYRSPAKQSESKKGLSSMREVFTHLPKTNQTSQSKKGLSSMRELFTNLSKEEIKEIITTKKRLKK